MKKETIIMVLLVIGIFATACSSPTQTSQTPTQTNTSSTGASVQTINIDAQRFQYTPSTITVKVGQPVNIIVNNIDTTHGIVIPDLGVSGIDSVQFTPTQTGTFQFRCPTPCGPGHMGMVGTLVVTN